MCIQKTILFVVFFKLDRGNFRRRSAFIADGSQNLYGEAADIKTRDSPPPQMTEQLVLLRPDQVKHEQFEQVECEVVDYEMEVSYSYTSLMSKSRSI